MIPLRYQTSSVRIETSGAEEQPDPKRPTILVVEDDEVDLFLSQKFLQGSGFQLTPAPAAAPPPLGEGAAILVVEDEAVVALALAAALRRDDHRVDTAANGRQALQRLQGQDYDLILCDMRMPELDGPGLFQAVATRQPHLLSRFIFLTGDTLSPESHGFLQRSGCLHLAKPFTAADSRRIVRQALQAQR